MKTRIVKHTIGGVVYFVAQYQLKWLPFIWRNIETYYRSDFTDMPGWWTFTHNTYEDAQRAVISWKTGNCCITTEIVHEK